jgi:4-hydroxy-tetrahydrodipicolinate reductase
MRVALLGYGKMGKALHKNLEEQGHTIGFIHETQDGIEVSDALLSCDVAIEFTGPENAVQNLIFCAEQGLPVVSGTTGWLDQWSEVQTAQRNHQAKILYGSNFSLGVQLFLEAAKNLAQLMKDRGDFKLHLEETHHLEKKDAPSGTAISLFNALKQGDSSLIQWSLDKDKTPESTVDTTSIRAFREQGAIGNHQAIWDGAIDYIKLEHHAKSRQGFVQGAIDSAEWLIQQQKPGLYSVRDVLGLT